MSKALRTALSLVVSLVLFSALTMAQPGGSNAGKDKNKEHHSRLSKVAFWRHHKDTDKKAKAKAPSKHAQAAKHAAGKSKTKRQKKAQDRKTVS